MSKPGRDEHIRRLLLSWFAAHARSLPWRRDRDWYRVWVAEVMLQQTRVEVVVPAYRRFLRTLPTLTALAGAEEEKVLSLWSGLGYYSRARSLHRAARIIDAGDRPVFPPSMAAALQLPGVGTYTAAAVLSIAYGLPHAAVDGNVNRVLSRLECLPSPNGRSQAVWSAAERLLDRHQPGDWNQALMELGEVICTPKAPSCEQCPLRRLCMARRCHDVGAYPPRRRRRAQERIKLRMIVVCDRRRRLLLERGAFPYLAHLWLPPIRVMSGIRKTAAPEAGAEAQGRFRHAILHRVFEVWLYSRVLTVAELRRQIRMRVAAGIECRLFDEAGLAGIGRSSLLTKALERVRG